MEKKIDGAFVSKVLYDELVEYLDEKSKSNDYYESLRPRVKIISVGDDFGSQMYGKMKKKKLTDIVGYTVDAEHYDDLSAGDLTLIIENANRDGMIDGIMLQLPLPNDLARYERLILDQIDSKKDVDGLTSQSLGKLMVGSSSLESCTPKGIITLLKVYGVELLGKKVCIINRSNIVGKPLAHMFLKENATPIICHSKTSSLQDVSSNCDIVVAACNRQEMVDSSYIKDGAVVIDVGVHKNTEGKTVGDVSYDDCYDKCSLITPPTGGVGPMTICMLAYNTAKAKYGDEVEMVLDRGIEKAKMLVKKS